MLEDASLIYRARLARRAFAARSFPKAGWDRERAALGRMSGLWGNRAHPASLDCGVRSDASPLLRPQRSAAPALSEPIFLFFHATSRRVLRISGRAAACPA